MVLEGYIDGAGTPRVRVEIVGYRGSVKVDAILDTGFNGELCVPIPIAIQLGLELIGESLVTYADGRVEAELLFAGKAKVGEVEREVEITLTRGDEAILGTSLLREAKVLLDFKERKLKMKYVSRP